MYETSNLDEIAKDVRHECAALEAALLELAESGPSEESYDQAAHKILAVTRIADRLMWSV